MGRHVTELLMMHKRATIWDPKNKRENKIGILKILLS